MFRTFTRNNIKKTFKNFQYRNNYTNQNFNPKSLNYLNFVLPTTFISYLGYSYYNIKKNTELSDIENIKRNIEDKEISKITIIDDKKALFETQSKKILILDIPEYKYIENKLNINNIPVIFRHNENNPLLNQILLSSLFFGLFYFLMRRQTGGLNSMLQFSKNNQINVMKEIKLKFSDIIGQDNAVKLIKEYLDILKNYNKYKEIGAKIPKGALLYGPPGTGKTLLAKSLAGESNLPFVSLSGSDLNAMFVGLGAMKVKNLFQEAREKAKESDGCIIFIDEIDAIGQKRGTNGMNVNTERENTLNQLLTEMDGFEESKNIIVLGATNRVDTLDNALLRPGRFDRKIQVDLPSLLERKELFTFYLNKLTTKLDDNQMGNIIENIAKLTPGFSGADISNICNESAIISVRENEGIINEEQIKKAVDYVMLGSEKHNLISLKEKEIIAYHEAGHALISYLLENTPNPIKVSIVPREKGMLGFSQSEFSQELLISKKNIEDQLCVLMAGRICEEVFTGDITNGASNDIEKATELLDKYLKLFCMGEQNKFYKIQEKDNSFVNNYGNKTKDDNDNNSIKILNSLYKQTKDIIINNKDKIEMLKESLISKDTIYQDEINEIMVSDKH